MEDSIPENDAQLVGIFEDTPLADSREIAKKLGIEHRSFISMVNDYLESIEAAFGKVRFQIAPSGKTKQPLRYVLLTANQTWAYMSLARNTPEAVDCKILLVKAFAAALDIIKRLEDEQEKYKEQRRVFIDVYCARAAINHNRVPRGNFGVQDALAGKLFRIKWINNDLEAEDYLENSVSAYWSDWATSEWNYPPERRQKYDHILPVGWTKPVYMYPSTLRDEFDWWFEHVYLTGKGYQNYLKYLAKKRAKAVAKTK